jgi:hypothetical protein
MLAMSKVKPTDELFRRRVVLAELGYPADDLDDEAVDRAIFLFWSDEFTADHGTVIWRDFHGNDVEASMAHRRPDAPRFISYGRHMRLIGAAPNGAYLRHGRRGAMESPILSRFPEFGFTTGLPASAYIIGV